MTVAPDQRPRPRRSSPTRRTARASIPQPHPANLHGVLQADAYDGYDKVFADGNVREVACMAPARRKIHDLHISKSTSTTTEALRKNRPAVRHRGTMSG